MYPVIGGVHVRDVALPHVLKVIESLWVTKTETASRVLGRIEAVLDWAKVRGQRTGDNPARWKGNLDMLLPARNKVAKVEHNAALPWKDCPAFMKRIACLPGNAAKALEFCILTECRSGEVRGARWEEFDLELKVCTIPADRMKAGKEHRVPLSAAALALLQKMRGRKILEFVFPNPNGGRLSEVVFSQLIRGMEFTVTAHGFRSSWLDWAGEATNFPREVIEHALAHQLKDKAEAAYARGDLFTKRMALMAEWAGYLEGVVLL